VHRLTQAAFAGYAWLDPPSGALAETEDAVLRDLAQHAGLLARLDRQPVGCLRFERKPLTLQVRRVAVLPAFQGRGMGRAMMDWMRAYARQQSIPEIEVGVRSQLPANRAFYERLGYRVVQGHSHPGREDITWYEMRLRL
jgi:GNAT superfamily N-acetyltransferase